MRTGSSLFRPFLALVLVSAGAGVLAAAGKGAPAAAPDASPGTYEIDGGHSSVVFKVRHMDLAPFYGRFNEVKGQFVVAEDPTESTVRVEIPAASVDTNSEGRDKHLRSPDFFNAEQFPLVLFQSTDVEPQGEGRFLVHGNLELHGKSEEVSLDMRLVDSGDRGRRGYRAGFEGSFSFERSKFGMQGYLDSISDEVEVLLGIQGVRQ